MKKLFVLAICFVSAIVFAQAYSKAKFNQVLKQGYVPQTVTYCYQAQVSPQSDYHHMYGYAVYCMEKKQDKKLTADQIKSCAKKFQSISKKYYDKALVVIYARCGFQSEALKIAGNNSQLILDAKRNAFTYYVAQKNKDKAWSLGTQVLINNGQGVVNYKDATRILNEMFRYKPASITKEQQIEFLTELSQIYPIPGTDFNNWKGFMGFVGYKYKALTGKELF